jgi:hypothetical protein
MSGLGSDVDAEVSATHDRIRAGFENESLIRHRLMQITNEYPNTRVTLHRLNEPLHGTLEVSERDLFVLSAERIRELASKHTWGMYPEPRFSAQHPHVEIARAVYTLLEEEFWKAKKAGPEQESRALSSYVHVYDANKRPIYAVNVP